MTRYVLAAIALIAAPAPAFAGGGVGYTATDAEGTVERLLETRALPDERTGALVSFTRTDGTRTLMEYAFQCEPLEYAYLGMVDDKAVQVPNLRTVRVASDSKLGNIVPVAMRPLGDDPLIAPIRALAEKVCA